MIEIIISRTHSAINVYLLRFASIGIRYKGYFNQLTDFLIVVDFVVELSLMSIYDTTLYTK